MYVYCLGCDSKLEVGEELYGQICSCPKCGAEVSVPRKDEIAQSLEDAIKPRERSVQQKPTDKKKTNSVNNKPQEYKPYKSPILSFIFRIDGLLSIAVAVLAFVFCVLGEVPQAKREFIIYVTAGAIANAVISFGISEMLEYIAKTAYYTEKTSNQLCQLLERN